MTNRVNRRAEEFVFVSYARKDRQKVVILVDRLTAAGINVWWDRGIEIGSVWRDAIQHHLDQAACVLVVWTKNSTESTFVRSEATWGNPLLQVKLESDATIPVGFTEDQHCDLTDWNGDDSPALCQLIEAVTRAVDRGSKPVDGLWTLETTESDIQGTLRATAELREVALKLRSLAELASSDVAATDDLRATFVEIDKTFQVVNDTLLKFLRPLSAPGEIELTPYLELERDKFLSRVNAGLGHCRLITVIYERHGGLRDWLVGVVETEQLDDADRLFAGLSDADNDAFGRMVTIAKILRNESRIIAAHILSGQQVEARSRLIKTRDALSSVEDALSSALEVMAQIRARFGIPASVPQVD